MRVTAIGLGNFSVENVRGETFRGYVLHEASAVYDTLHVPLRSEIASRTLGTWWLSCASRGEAGRQRRTPRWNRIRERSGPLYRLARRLTLQGLALTAKHRVLWDQTPRVIWSMLERFAFLFFECKPVQCDGSLEIRRF